MKGFVLGLIIVFLGTQASAFSSKKAPKEQAVSTQGIELSEDIAKSKQSKEEKNEQKQIRNRSKKYIRYNKKLKHQNFKKEEQLKELEYLQKRLELKKNKLETKFPADVKGEQE